MYDIPLIVAANRAMSGVYEELKMAAALVVIDEEEQRWEFLTRLVLDSLPAISSRRKYRATP
jgi:hypothetical protein